jgi:hypothetical protein
VRAISANVGPMPCGPEGQSNLPMCNPMRIWFFSCLKCVLDGV